MKRVLVHLPKRDYKVEIGGKSAVALAGNYYCYKCGYKMIPEIQIEGKGNLQRAEFFIDTACHCDAR
jgi:hypothetical protein